MVNEENKSLDIKLDEESTHRLKLTKGQFAILQATVNTHKALIDILSNKEQLDKDWENFVLNTEQATGDQLSQVLLSMANGAKSAANILQGSTFLIRRLENTITEITQDLPEDPEE